MEQSSFQQQQSILDQTRKWKQKEVMEDKHRTMVRSVNTSILSLLFCIISSSKCYHFNTYLLLFDFSTGYGGGGGGGGVVVLEASSGVQPDGSTTIEVDGGARGWGPSGRSGNAGSDGALFIVSNINVIVVCN